MRVRYLHCLPITLAPVPQLAGKIKYRQMICCCSSKKFRTKKLEATSNSFLEIISITVSEKITRTFGKGTLLVAEDDELIRKFLERLLTQRGFTIVLAEDGEEAIRKYQEHGDSIDMLILDVMLPGRNGSEVYDVIKSDRPDIKVLFISGYTDDIITADGISDDNLQFLSKPIDAEELLAIVMANMESRDAENSKKSFTAEAQRTLRV